MAVIMTGSAMAKPFARTAMSLICKAAEAVRVVRQRDKTRPLFMFFSLGAPHLPNEAPQQAISAYAHIADEKRRIHAAMVERA
jgi:hypothetical protein